MSIFDNFDIEVLVDIRSVPFSEHTPWFNRDMLARALSKRGILYHYMGDLLGGRPKDPTCYRNGKPDYALIRQKEFYQKGLQRLMEGIKKYTIVIMCAEEDPAKCHRRNLVGMDLYKSGLKIIHIRHALGLEEDRYEKEMLIEAQGKLFD